MVAGIERRYRVLLAGVILVPLCLLHAALEPLERSFTVRRWTADDGLPSNSVQDLGFGPDGLLWGVSGSEIWRFDGERFVTTPAAIADHLDKGKGIRALKTVSDGSVFLQIEESGSWFKNGAWERCVYSERVNYGNLVMSVATTSDVWSVTAIGLLRQTGGKQTFFPGPEEVVKAGGRFTWASPDAAGSTVWLSAVQGLYRYFQGHFTPVEVTATREANFERVCVGASGQVWLYGHPDRFYVLRGGVWEALPKPVGEWPVRMGVEVMAERNGSELWVGTADGLFRWDGLEWCRLEPGGLAPSGVIALHVGREGEVWAGMEGGGLLCLRERNIHITHAQDGPAVQAFSAVYERQDGVLCAGIANAGLWSGPLDRLERMDIPKLYKKATVLAIAEDGLGSLLLGPTGGSLLRYRKGATELIFPGKNVPWMDFGVRSLLVDPAGRTWVGTQRGLMFERVQEAELNWVSRVVGQEQYAVNALARTADGMLWAASDRFGVIAVTPDGPGAFYTRPEIPVPFADVRALRADSRGRLWAGGPRGLAYRGDDGAWRPFEIQRLGTVVQILEDASGKIWVGTLQGIARVTPSAVSPEVIWFGHEDGLDSEVCSGGFGSAGCRLRDGRLLFPTQDGLAVVDPQRLNMSDSPVAPLVDEVLADGRPVWQKNPFDGLLPVIPLELTVPAGTRAVTVRYLASDTAEGGTVLFRHRLGTEPAAWSPWTATREAVFEKLPPASYPFSLQVMMRDGKVAGLVSAPVIRILPLWWQRRSVQSVGIACLALAVGAGIWRLGRRRMRRRLAQAERERMVEAERLRIARDIHDRIGAKLTKIGLQNQRLIREPGLTAACQPLIQGVADTTRETILSMDEIVWAINPQNDTLENSINYLIHYTREFLRPAQIPYALDLPIDLPVRSLSGEIRHNLFMAFNEALNNAVKHGRPRRVRLSLALGTDRLALTVEDDGCGFTPGEGQAGADGLENMRRRMKSVGGCCRVESAPGEGTRVIFEMPLT